ncbi:hypothetical protein Tco_0442265 [Tanacetum coccineum]|uniref:Uncharacterized protein n=1 Tax=Tanacetum coccineum TaxID=301880 RepID=A0ABQ5IU65_9ASTR
MLRTRLERNHLITLKDQGSTFSTTKLARDYNRKHHSAPVKLVEVDVHSNTLQELSVQYVILALQPRAYRHDSSVRADILSRTHGDIWSNYLSHWCLGHSFLTHIEMRSIAEGGGHIIDVRYTCEGRRVDEHETVQESRCNMERESAVGGDGGLTHTDGTSKCREYSSTSVRMTHTFKLARVGLLGSWHGGGDHTKRRDKCRVRCDRGVREWVGGWWGDGVGWLSLLDLDWGVGKCGLMYLVVVVFCVWVGGVIFWGLGGFVTGTVDRRYCDVARRGKLVRRYERLAATYTEEIEDYICGITHRVWSTDGGCHSVSEAYMGWGYIRGEMMRNGLVDLWDTYSHDRLVSDVDVRDAQRILISESGDVAVRFTLVNTVSVRLLYCSDHLPIDYVERHRVREDGRIVSSGDTPGCGSLHSSEWRWGGVATLTVSDSHYHWIETRSDRGSIRGTLRRVGFNIVRCVMTRIASLNTYLDANLSVLVLSLKVCAYMMVGVIRWDTVTTVERIASSRELCGDYMGEIVIYGYSLRVRLIQLNGDVELLGWIGSRFIVFEWGGCVLGWMGRGGGDYGLG